MTTKIRRKYIFKHRKYTKFKIKNGSCKIKIWDMGEGTVLLFARERSEFNLWFLHGPQSTILGNPKHHQICPYSKNNKKEEYNIIVHKMRTTFCAWIFRERMRKYLR